MLDLFQSDRELAEKLSLGILEDAKAENSTIGLVRSNYYLGYLQKRKGDLGKAIIYYLEGIRYGESAKYDGANKDLVGLLKNTGTIFMKFQNYDLAEKYFQEASELASSSGLINEYVRLMYAHARLLKAKGQLSDAILILESTFDDFSAVSNKTIANIYSLLGSLYAESKDFQNADETFDKLILFVKDKEGLQSEFLTRAYHNLGMTAFTAGDYEVAAEHYKEALILKKKYALEDESIFLTSKDLGESLMMSGDIRKAEKYLLDAEKLYSSASSVSKHYEVFKLLSIINKKKGDLSNYSRYQDLYAQNLEAYVAERHEIEASDKKYNLDLITERYYAMVAEQERNKQITFYSKVGGASLVSLLFMVIGIFYYRKWKLKKDLEQAIKPLTNRI